MIKVLLKKLRPRVLQKKIELIGAKNLCVLQRKVESTGAKIKRYKNLREERKPVSSDMKKE